MGRYTGGIKLVILDLAGTVCDGPQDMRKMFPNDDLKGVKVPVISFEKVFAKRGMNVDWATIRKPMGLFKREHLGELFKDKIVSDEFKRAFGRQWTDADIEEMFKEFRAVVPKIATTDDLVMPIDGVRESMARLREAGILLGCDTGYPVEACTVGIFATGEHGKKELAGMMPDFLAPSVKDLPEIVFSQIEPRLKRGESPGQMV